MSDPDDILHDEDAFERMIDRADQYRDEMRDRIAEDRANRPTPETDEADYVVDSDEHVYVCIDHARRLEREREELSEMIVELRGKLACAERERDKLREKLNNDVSGIHSCSPYCQRPNCVLRRKLKEERALADRLANILKRWSNNTEANKALAAWKESRK